MGRLRKVLVGAVAALATLGAGLVGVSAANAADTPAIFIKDSSVSGNIPATDYSAYKLAGYDTSDSTASGSGDSASLDKVTGTSAGASVDHAIARALHSADAADYPADGTADPRDAVQELLNLTDTATIASVANALKADTGSLGTAHQAGTAGNPLDIPVGSEGLYLVVGPTGTLPMIVSTGMTKGTTTYYNLNSRAIGTSAAHPLQAKNGASYTPKKTYTNAAGEGPSASDPSASEPYVAVGDYAHFTITMTVPDKNNYQSFTLSDTPSGYTLDVNSGAHKMTISAGSGPSLTTYTVTSLTPATQTLGTNSGTSIAFSGTGVPSGGFVITDNQFTEPVGSHDAAWRASHTNENSLIAKDFGQTLTVSYWAKVTSADASNAVSSQLTDFTGNPGPPKPGKPTHNGSAAEPLARFTKVEAVNRQHGLNNAVFTLQNVGGTIGGKNYRATNEYWHRTGSGPWSHSTVTGSDLSSVEMTTASLARPSGAAYSNVPADGVLDLDGLSSGVYLLTEQTAPTGYLAPVGGVTTTAIYVDVADDGTVTEHAADATAAGLLKDDVAGRPGSLAYDAEGNRVPANDVTGAEHVFSLGNLHNVSELPATGGAGIIAGLILLALLLLVGGTLIAISRRMRRNRMQAQGVRE